MTIQSSASGSIVLDGACTSDDAETLLQQLLAAPASVVDWRTCESIHTAVLQVLLAAKPRLLGPPSGRFLRDWVEPRLTAGSA
jgi:hypothetical protein